MPSTKSPQKTANAGTWSSREDFHLIVTDYHRNIRAIRLEHIPQGCNSQSTLRVAIAENRQANLL
jgi:hypothetical protein